MAHYSNETVRYRGRIVEVWFRYGIPHETSVKKGKPLILSQRDHEKILRILRRRGKVDRQGYDHHSY